MSAAATGGDVPAFSGATVIAPDDLVRLAPLRPGLPTYLPHAAALPITWTGAAKDDVEVSLVTTLSDARIRTVAARCTFPGASGSATIAREVMGQLDRANGTSIIGTIEVHPVNETHIRAGDWDVAFRAQAMGWSGEYEAYD